MFYSCETLNNTKRNEDFYKPTCMAGRKKWLGMLVQFEQSHWCHTHSFFSHEGFEFKSALFPASACIKVSGHYGKVYFEIWKKTFAKSITVSILVRFWN